MNMMCAYQGQFDGCTPRGTPFWKGKVDFDVEEKWWQPICRGEKKPSDPRLWKQAMTFSGFRFPRLYFDEFCAYIKQVCGSDIEVVPLKANPDITIVREITIKVPICRLWARHLAALIKDWIILWTGNYQTTVNSNADEPKAPRPAKRQRRREESEAEAARPARRRRVQEAAVEQREEITPTTATTSIENDAIVSPPLRAAVDVQTTIPVVSSEATQAELTSRSTPNEPELGHSSGSSEMWQSPEQSGYVDSGLMVASGSDGMEEFFDFEKALKERLLTAAQEEESGNVV